MSTSGPHRVFIAGSCVTRDAFPAADAGPWRICGYHARSSLASLAGLPGGIDARVAEITSSFQRRMVEWDQGQQLKQALEHTAFDVLVLDLIDERFGLLQRADGSVVTLSTEYMSVAQRPLEGTVIRSGCEAHHRLWLAGLEVLIGTLRRRGLLDRVLVNRALWARTDAQGEALPVFSLEQIEQANQFLHRLYGELAKVFAPSAFIDYPVELLVADRGHRWGCSPYHYTAAFYEITRSRVQAFAAAPMGLPDVALGARLHATPPAPAVRRTAATVVSTEVADVGLTVSVGPPAQGTTALHAFYLFRNDTRVAQTEYGPASSTLFPVPNIPGNYRAVAFVKDRASGKIDRFTGAARQFPDAREYDLSRWRGPVHESTADQSLYATDGIHVFRGDGTTSLDFLLQDFGAVADAAAILVCFNGSVSQRSTKIGPFFAGTSVGRRLKLPVICVADPVVARARDIPLAWYAGADEHPDLARTIARHLDAVAAEVNRPLVLLGGSGGGYAALAVVRHLRTTATAVACNPQTAIRRYHRQSVVKYLERAFPVIARRQRIAALSAPQQTPERLGEVLTLAGVRDDLADTDESGLHRSIILQNAGDRHHVEHHLTPLLDAVGAQWAGPRAAHRGDRFGAWLGHWGDGHVSPPTTLIDLVASRVAAAEPVRSIIEDLELRFGDTSFVGSRPVVASTGS